MVAGPSEILAPQVLGRGRACSAWVLALRVVRAASWVLVMFGIAVAVAFGRSDQLAADDLATAEGMADAVSSPLVLFASGVGLRLLLTPTGYLAALGASLAGTIDVGSTRDGRSRWTRLFDRLRLASATRSLWWTVAVRDEAVQRSGQRGRTALRLELGLRVLAWAGGSIAIVVVALAR